MFVDIKSLPTAGPSFEVGECVAFFPAEIGPTSMWMRWDDAIIEEVDEAARTFGFHFVSEPGVRHGQGFENIARKTANYDAWRAAWESTFARTGDEDEADREAAQLRVRVLAEHPVHGRGGPYPHKQLKAAEPEPTSWWRRWRRRKRNAP